MPSDVRLRIPSVLACVVVGAVAITGCTGSDTPATAAPDGPEPFVAMVVHDGPMLDRGPIPSALRVDGGDAFVEAWDGLGVTDPPPVVDDADDVLVVRFADEVGCEFVFESAALVDGTVVVTGAGSDEPMSCQPAPRPRLLALAIPDAIPIDDVVVEGWTDLLVVGTTD